MGGRGGRIAGFLVPLRIRGRGPPLGVGRKAPWTMGTEPIPAAPLRVAQHVGMCVLCGGAARGRCGHRINRGRSLWCGLSWRRWGGSRRGRDSGGARGGGVV